MIHQFVRGRWDLGLCRSSCLNYLHRLRFAFKCPKKRLTKADDAKQEAFVAEYAALLDEAGRTGGKIFFADGAHFRADAELRGKWTLKGEPPWRIQPVPVVARRPATIRQCAWRPARWNRWDWAGIATAKAPWLSCTSYARSILGLCKVIWNNAPTHSGEAPREYLRTSGLGLELVNLPGYSPDFNADEAIWVWAKEEVTGNLCLGSKALVQETVNNFLARLTSRKDEMKLRCWIVLQSRAEGLARASHNDSGRTPTAHPTLALV